MSYVNANEVLPDDLVQEIQKYLDGQLFVYSKKAEQCFFMGRKERHQRQNGRTKQTDTGTVSFRSSDLRTERRVLPFGKADPGNHTCM